MRSNYLALYGVAASLLAAGAIAAEPSPPTYLLRIGPPALSSLHGTAVDCENTVEDEVLGTTIRGTAKTAAVSICERSTSPRVG